MSDISLSILISFFLSIVIWFIDLSNSIEKSRIKSLFCIASFLYLLLLCSGNFTTTLLAANFINNSESLSESGFLKNYSWFWYAFAGVFGFEAIIQNINLSFQEKGFLTLNLKMISF